MKNQLKELRFDLMINKQMLSYTYIPYAKSLKENLCVMYKRKEKNKNKFNYLNFELVVTKKSICLINQNIKNIKRQIKQIQRSMAKINIV